MAPAAEEAVGAAAPAPEAAPEAGEQAQGGESLKVEDSMEAKLLLKKLMDTTVRVRVSDGRLITGQMWCVDQLQNMVLLNGQETRVAEDGSQQHRPLGPLVMVPGRHITRVEALRKCAEDAHSAARLEARRLLEQGPAVEAPGNVPAGKAANSKARKAAKAKAAAARGEGTREGSEAPAAAGSAGGAAAAAPGAAA